MNPKPIVEPLPNGLSAVIVASGVDGAFTVVYSLMHGDKRVDRHQLIASFESQDAAYAAGKAAAEERARELGI